MTPGTTILPDCLTWDTASKISTSDATSSVYLESDSDSERSTDAPVLLRVGAAMRLIGWCLTLTPSVCAKTYICL